MQVLPEKGVRWLPLNEFDPGVFLIFEDNRHRLSVGTTNTLWIFGLINHITKHSQIHSINTM